MGNAPALYFFGRNKNFENTLKTLFNLDSQLLLHHKLLLGVSPARKRQAMVPDFHVLIARQALLMELQTVHHGTTCFNSRRNGTGGVEEKRASTINSEYEKEAKTADKDWGPEAGKQARRFQRHKSDGGANDFGRRKK